MSEADILAQWRAELNMPEGNASDAAAWWRLVDEAEAAGRVAQGERSLMLRHEGWRL